MKIIFLDFDGVLNSENWYRRQLESGIELPTSFLQRTQLELDTNAVVMMSDFVKEIGASVVASTSWRILHPIEELRAALVGRGWTACELLDITPRSRKGFRGDEINAWLQDSTKRNVEILEPITHHVIFDDDGDFYPTQPLIKTTWEMGLQEAHIDLARGILLR